MIMRKLKSSISSNVLFCGGISIINNYRKRFAGVLLLLLILMDLFNFTTSNNVFSLMPEPVTNQSTFIAWLKNTGRLTHSRYHGYAANYEVYKNYKLLTYGTPQNVSGNRYDSGSKQYAMHGFSYDEYTVTNTYFPDDTTGVSDPRKWNNINLGQDATISWMRLTTREKEHIQNSKLFYSGKSFNGMTFKSLSLSQQNCIVLAIPSWTLGFALYTSHYNSNNQIRYGTLSGDGIGGIVIQGSVKISPAKANLTFEINSNQEYIDLTFNNSASITAYNGLAKSSDISRGGIIFNGKSYESQGAGPWNLSQTIRYSRISTNPSTDFTRTISIKTTIWVVSALGDLVSKEITTSFTIIEKAKSALKGNMSISGAISLFDGKKTMTGYNLPFNKKRFLCLEKITLRIDFEGAPMPNSVTFYPLGGKTTTAMVIKTSYKTGYAQLIYPMGIIPSTLTWSNVRVNPAYSCYASSYIGSKRTDYVISGIEITGDIYDLVYLDAPYIY